MELVNGQQKAVPGYEDPEDSLDNDTLVVINTLKKMDWSFIKTGAGEILEGVQFTISGGGLSSELSSTSDNLGEVSFEGLPISPTNQPYVLTEIETLAGYRLGQNGKTAWKFKIVEGGNGELQLEWIDENPLVDNEFNNQLKDFNLLVNKKDDSGEVLFGAQFTLYDSTGKKVIQALPNESDTAQRSTFEFKNLEPGTYILEETITPEGFIGLSDPITITITNTGVVTVSGYEVTENGTGTTGLPLAKLSLTTGTGNNTISFDVANKKKIPLPSTGGSGTMFFVAIGVLGLLSTGLYFLQRKDQEVA